MLVVTSPDTRRHDPAHEIGLGRVVQPRPERPERIDAVERAVLASGIPTQVATGHDESVLRRVHDDAYVDWLRDGYVAWRAAGGPPVLLPDTFPNRAWDTHPPTSPIGAAGWWLTDTATPVVEGSWPTVLAAVDVALTCVDLVTSGEQHLVHGATRPPGHHAGPAYGGGFCLVNHAALAAQALVEATGGRVAVVDVDHHHGNGTQQAFWERADVLYVSLHADPAQDYPWFSGHADEVGDGPGRGTTRNLPLQMGTDDDSYLAALEVACEEVARFGADAVVLSLGVDTAASDPVGGLGLSPDAYPRIGQVLSTLRLPTVSLQEGGYDLERVGPDTVAVLQGLTGA